MIGDFIAELRKEKKLTQKDLGEILNVDAKKISKWEKNITLPDCLILNALADALGVSTKELLQGKRDSTSTSDMKVEEKKEEKQKEEEQIDKDIVKNIDRYIKKEKIRTIIEVTVLSLLVLIVSITISLTIVSSKKYYENKIYIAHGENEDFRVEAKLIKSDSNQFNILVINNIEYFSDKVGTSEEPLITNLTLSVIIDGETKYSKSDDYAVETPIQTAVTGKMIYLENFEIDSEEIKLTIDYQDQNKNLISDKDTEIIILDFKDTY